jgi:hypothetical protein
MKTVSADSFCSVVWWGARAACAEVSIGSVGGSKARLGFKSMASGIYGRIQKMMMMMMNYNDDDYYCYN